MNDTLIKRPHSRKAGVYPSAERIRELFDIDDSWQFTWKKRAEHEFKNNLGYKIFNGRYAGKVAGGETVLGYGIVGVSELGRVRCLLIHRLVWILENGEIPAGHEIDHRDGNPRNNHPDNLKCVPHSENMKNVKLRSDNRTGVCGVQMSANGEKFLVLGSVNGKNTYLGTFDTLDEAAAVSMAHRSPQNGYSERHGQCAINQDNDEEEGKE